MNGELNNNEERKPSVEPAHRDDYSSEEIKKLKEKNEKLQREITKYRNRVSRKYQYKEDVIIFIARFIFK